MKKIGLDGVVNKISMEDITRIKASKNKRIALIVKSEYEYKDLQLEGGSIELVFKENKEVMKEKINIISVNLVKGMEFETVYVYPKGMTKNEKYVAYTRALDELNIIEEPFEKSIEKGSNVTGCDEVLNKYSVLSNLCNMVEAGLFDKKIIDENQALSKLENEGYSFEEIEEMDQAEIIKIVNSED